MPAFDFNNPIYNAGGRITRVMNGGVQLWPAAAPAGIAILSVSTPPEAFSSAVVMMLTGLPKGAVIVVNTGRRKASTCSVTDSQGNNYTQRMAYGGTQYLYEAAALQAGDVTITVSQQGADYMTSSAMALPSSAKYSAADSLSGNASFANHQILIPFGHVSAHSAVFLGAVGAAAANGVQAKDSSSNFLVDVVDAGTRSSIAFGVIEAEKSNANLVINYSGAGSGTRPYILAVYQ